MCPEWITYPYEIGERLTVHSKGMVGPEHFLDPVNCALFIFNLSA